MCVEHLCGLAYSSHHGNANSLDQEPKMNANQFLTKAVSVVFALTISLGISELIAGNMERAGSEMRAAALQQNTAYSALAARSEAIVTSARGS
jgi:hypothetical protein